MEHVFKGKLRFRNFVSDGFIIIHDDGCVEGIFTKDYFKQKQTHSQKVLDMILILQGLVQTDRGLVEKEIYENYLIVSDPITGIGEYTYELFDNDLFKVTVKELISDIHQSQRVLCELNKLR